MSMYSIGNDLYSGRLSYKIIQHRKIWFAIAGVFVAITLLAFAFKTPNLGIEFRGGSQFTISGAATQDQQPAYDVIAKIGKDSAPRVSSLGQTGMRVQTAELDADQTQAVKEGLAEAYGVSADDVTSSYVGPSWGADIMNKAVRAMIVFMVLVCVVLMIYFRSWSIAVGALLALLHDFLITLGVYWIGGLEITPATVIGLLTIMGYSLYDTVVVFDKVRENTAQLYKQLRFTYEESANNAINQTLIRSINTSVTGLMPVASVLLIGVVVFGADTLLDLALVIFVGMLLSTLSSIFIAAPLAVTLAERNADIKEHTKHVHDVRATLSNDVDGQALSKEESDMLEYVTEGERESGHHQGVSAQPRRKSRSKR